MKGKSDERLRHAFHIHVLILFNNSYEYVKD